MLQIHDASLKATKNGLRQLLAYSERAFLDLMTWGFAERRLYPRLYGSVAVGDKKEHGIATWNFMLPGTALSSCNADPNGPYSLFFTYLGSD